MFNKQGFFVYIRIIRVRASYYVNNIYIYIFIQYIFTARNICNDNI